jgi:beta-aspartyl-dipeptidase (metallo-type)
MILFKQCEVYSPDALGVRDVLIAGGRIVAVAEGIRPAEGCETEVVSCRGLRMIPGLIDGHVHIAGAGGEGGPATRTPEMPLSQMLEGGITTVIGCLGTDGFTRSVVSVLMKAKSLRAEGVSCWIYTGAYQVPTPTVLGDVGRDLALIEEVVGVGEVAIADHRSACPTVDELIRLASQARVGGMLGGKAGIVNLHMGDARDPFRILYDVVGRSELKLTQFLPTHCNRNRTIFEDAKTYGKQGYTDITTSAYSYFPDEEIKPSRAVAGLLAAGVPLAHVTMSSDACGSLPSFDEKGNLIRLETGRPVSVLRELKDLVLEERMPLEQALRLAGSNVADVLRLPRKGRLGPGMDADLVMLDGDFRIRHMLANGAWMIRDGSPIRKGTFE